MLDELSTCVYLLLQVDCAACSTCSSSVAPAPWLLPLPLPAPRERPVSIEECLSGCLKGSRECLVCGDEAREFSSFTSPPEILGLHLMRFQAKQAGTGKAKKMILEKLSQAVGTL